MTAIYTYLVPLGVSVNEPQANGKDVAGGYFIWITLPMGVDAETVSERCKAEEELVVAPGRLFEVTGAGREREEEEIRFERGLRLCFAWVEEEDLKEGVKRLSEVVQGVILSGTGEGTRGRKGGKVTKGDLGEFR
jgi:DNA-binding transcriptional MocR family regulator